MAHDQEVVGSNPSTVYWIDVSNHASYYTKEKLKIKVAKWGKHKKIAEIYFVIMLSEINCKYNVVSKYFNLNLAKKKTNWKMLLEST